MWYRHLKKKKKKKFIISENDFHELNDIIL